MIGPAPYVPGALEAITAGMSGQTISEAWNNGGLNNDNDLGYGVGNWTSDEPSISGNTGGTVSDSSEPVAVDAWHDYVENESGNVSRVTGGIVDGSAVSTINYSIMDNGNSLEAVEPVAVPIGQAATAISNALGVAMDWNVISPETAGAIATAFGAAGLLYDAASSTVKAWRDKLGNILFPKDAVAVMEAALEEQGIGDESQYAESDIASVPIPIGTTFYASNLESNRYLNEITITIQRGFAYHYNSTLFFIYGVANATGVNIGTVTTKRTDTRTGTVISETTTDVVTGGSNFTHNGQTVYYVGAGQVYYTQNYLGPDVVNNLEVSTNNAAWTALYGTISGGGGYPEGTAPSDAPTTYTAATYPTTGSIVTNPEGTDSIDVVTTHVPEDASTIGDDSVVTDPTDDETLDNFPDPPIPLPIPDTKPSNPSVPLVNPSVVDSTLINELIEELADTLDPQPPQSSGVIPVPPLPGIFDPSTGETTFPSIIPSSGPGFIHVYNPTPAEFVAFGTWLWVTYADATIDKILNNPFDGVIGAHELYATPNRDGSDNIRSAFLTCPTTAALVTNRYSEIDCGTVIVPEFYGNYLDYSPYSQAYIYLPFIGINEVSIDDIVGHAINIRYRVDSYSGSCIAMIFVAKDGYQNLCYQFAGSCSVEVPMAGGSQAAIKAGMMQAEAYARAAMIQAGANVVGGVGSALMGNIGGVLSSLSGIASNYAQAQAGVEAARVANKSSVQHSGQFGASHGAMGEKVPFIIIRNPIQVKVVNYNEDYGFPAHKRVIVGGCRGYLRVREVNVISAHATDEEKMAIEMALKGGVYVS